ncbi:hypothetical protein VTK73DRAFT_748 [Phialemonium thermophilum]|uniref:CFEM domain-containing protein n=1 Tax=Phialemonium thermophilum TaxID=223376 RepID=A0ABR3VUG5_9PEZI
MAIPKPLSTSPEVSYAGSSLTHAHEASTCWQSGLAMHLRLLVLVFFTATWQPCRADRFSEAAAQLPPCGLQCMLESVPSSNCRTPANTTCLCADEGLSALVLRCVQAHCSVLETLGSPHFQTSQSSPPCPGDGSLSDGPRSIRHVTYRSPSLPAAQAVQKGRAAGTAVAGRPGICVPPPPPAVAVVHDLSVRDGRLHHDGGRRALHTVPSAGQHR